MIMMMKTEKSNSMMIIYLCSTMVAILFYLSNTPLMEKYPNSVLSTLFT